MLLNIPQLPLLRLLRASSQDHGIVTKFGCSNSACFCCILFVVVCVRGSLLQLHFAQVDDGMSPPADLFAPTSYAILKLYVHYEVLEKDSFCIRGEVSI